MGLTVWPCCTFRTIPTWFIVFCTGRTFLTGKPCIQTVIVNITNMYLVHSILVFYSKNIYLRKTNKQTNPRYRYHLQDQLNHEAMLFSASTLPTSRATFLQRSGILPPLSTSPSLSTYKKLLPGLKQFVRPYLKQQWFPEIGKWSVLLFEISNSTY